MNALVSATSPSLKRACAGACALVLLSATQAATSQTSATPAFSGSLMDAVLLTLQSSDGVAASKQQLAASEGALLSARAPFDTVWTAGASQQQSVRPQIALAGGGDFASRQLGYSAGVSRRLESGTVINPAITINRTRDDAANATAPSYSNVARG